MIAFDPLERLSLADAKFHPWVLEEAATKEEIISEF